MTYAEILIEVENFINANTDRHHRTFSRGLLLQLMAKYHQQKLQQKQADSNESHTKKQNNRR